MRRIRRSRAGIGIGRRRKMERMQENPWTPGCPFIIHRHVFFPWMPAYQGNDGAGVTGVIPAKAGIHGRSRISSMGVGMNRCRIECEACMEQSDREAAPCS